MAEHRTRRGLTAATVPEQGTERGPAAPGVAERPSERGLRAALVRRAHGVRGEVRMLPLGGDPDRFHPGLRVHVEGSGAPLTITSARALDDGDVLVRFEEVPTREAAGALAGRYLCVDPADVRELGPGEWFVHELIGLRAITPAGEELGDVTEVEDRPGQDTLVVAGAAGEARYPLARAFVERVDLPAGVIVITPWQEA